MNNIIRAFLWFGAIQVIVIAIVVALFNQVLDGFDERNIAKEKQALVVLTQEFTSGLHSLLVDNSEWDDAYKKITLNYDNQWVVDTYESTVGTLDILDALYIFSHTAKNSGDLHFKGIDEDYQAILAENEATILKSLVGHIDNYKQPGLYKLLIGDTVFVISYAKVRPYNKKSFTAAELSADPKYMAMVDVVRPSSWAKISKQYKILGLKVTKNLDKALSSRHLVKFGEDEAGEKFYVTWTSVSVQNAVIKQLLPYIVVLVILLVLGYSLIITRGRALSKQLMILAYYDELTGLCNRTLFQEKVLDALARSKRDGKHLAILFLDLDGFKEVNDLYGHRVGDSVLKRVGDILTDVMRDCDTIARMGGDEFTIMLEDLDTEGEAIEASVIVSHKILNAFEQPFYINNTKFSITTSIGISTFPEHGKDYDTLINSADTAMYGAKSSGKSGILVYGDMTFSNQDNHVQKVREIKVALKENQFVVFFQPIMSLENDEILSFEALVRWQHPEKGLVYPDDFIPFAERNGLIGQIDWYVIQTSLKQLSLWHEQGHENLGMSINLSAAQLHESKFVDELCVVFQHLKLDPKFVKFEITETAALVDTDKTISILNGITDMGAKIALDDFGTGFSSLTYLKKFPISYLKIDKSFVADMVNSFEDQRIVIASISMAHSLDIITIAEGVETAAHVDACKSIGCDQAQGYFYSKPVPASEANLLLDKKQNIA